MSQRSPFANKWTTGIEKHGYTAIPNLLLNGRKELGITIPEVYTLIAVETFRWSNRKPWPSLDAISKLTGLTTRSTRMHLSSLEKKGIIQRKSRPGLTNTYDAEALIMKLDILANKYPQPGKKWSKSKEEYFRPPQQKTSAKEDLHKQNALKRGLQNQRGGTQQLSDIFRSIQEKRMRPKKDDDGP